MKVIVTKPVDGKVTVSIDDSRGITGLRSKREGVALQDVGSVATALATVYEQRREAVRKARKGENPVP